MTNRKMANRPRSLPYRIRRKNQFFFNKRRFKKKTKDELSSIIFFSRQLYKTIIREYYKTPEEAKSILKQLEQHDYDWCLSVIQDCWELFKKVPKDKQWHKRFYREISYNLIYKHYDLIEFKNRREMDMSMLNASHFPPLSIDWVFNSVDLDFYTRSILHRISMGDSLKEVLTSFEISIEELKRSFALYSMPEVLQALEDFQKSVPFL